MKHLLSILLIFSICLTQELKVEGDLIVTGSIQSADSLKQRVVELELIIAQLQAQMTNLIINGDCNEYLIGIQFYDACGICGGDSINNEDCYVYDIEGNNYTLTQIGNQLWMAENLQTTLYQDGSTISGYTQSDWGLLYGNEIFITQKEVCPASMHIPSEQDWVYLKEYLGDNPGGKLKSTGNMDEGTGYWDYPNIDATDEYGFSAHPTGIFFESGLSYFGEKAPFYDELGQTNVLMYRNGSISGPGFESGGGILEDLSTKAAIRCVKD